MTQRMNELLHLRAKMARIAHEVDALADLASIVDVRTHAPAVAEKIRNAVMAPDCVSASEASPL
jgi:hypothetical protein